MGLDRCTDSFKIGRDKSVNTLGFLMGRNLKMILPHITRFHFYIWGKEGEEGVGGGGGGGGGQVLRLSKQDKAQKQVWVRPGIEGTHPPLTFGIMSVMNFCPPKPGPMVITRTMSTRETKGTTSSTGVPGLMPIPT